MKAIGTKTYSATAVQAKSGQRWYLIDAEGQILGRVATTVAQLIRGKGKPTFTPHMDGGDYVIVVNADKIVVTGNKESDKIYYHHSQYPGGLRSTPLREMRAKHPGRILEAAVRGMLPKNSLGDKIFLHMKIYAGPDHPHESQQPIKLELAREGHKRGQITKDSAAESLDAAAGTTPAHMIERAEPAKRRRKAQPAQAEEVAATAPVATEETGTAATAPAEEEAAVDTAPAAIGEEQTDEQPATGEKDEQA